VRHSFKVKTNDGGKPGEVNLRILLVWQKTKWRMEAACGAGCKNSLMKGQYKKNSYSYLFGICSRNNNSHFMNEAW